MDNATGQERASLPTIDSLDDEQLQDIAAYHNWARVEYDQGGCLQRNLSADDEYGWTYITEEQWRNWLDQA